MSESVSLQINLIPLAVAIFLISLSTSIAVALVRKVNQAAEPEEGLTSTAQLTLVIAVGLVGVVFLFQGLFE